MNDDLSQNDRYMMPDAIVVGFSGCCPRCGQGRLYDGLLKPANACRACGLDFGFIDAGDGPAVFVILIIGFLALGLAMAVQSSFNPPIWLQVIIWGPAVLAASLWGLRFAKGIMISLQFKTKAREGEISSDADA